jgi:hypothetical protein
MIYLKYSHRAASLLVFLPMVSMGQRAQENVVPLKNWATPLYWQPNQAESRAGSQGAVPQLQFSANAVSTNALTFIAITPCRLVDTRGAAAGFNGEAPFDGPSIASKATLTIPVQSPTEATTNTTPAPCGVIPSIAQAYSFNLTVVPVAAGAVDYVTMWPAGSTQPVVATLDDPQGAIVSNAAIVPAGPSASPGYGGVSVYNDGPASANVIIDMNGYFAAPSDLLGNTAIGSNTLASNTTGGNNTASGTNALEFNTAGCCNTADGGQALQNNTTGNGNTAVGLGALNANTTSDNNTAVGFGALYHNTNGINNTAVGAALVDNTTGSNNTASGFSALQYNTTGSQNTASGTSALAANTTGNNNTASGQAALQFNTIGNQNTGIGTAALAGNTTGNYNTAVGAPSLPVNTTGSQNTAIGTGSLGANTTGSNNTASGQAALFSNTIGVNNTATGYQALQSNTTANSNTASGYQALQSNTTGNFNTASGSQALVNNTTGGNNIAIGYEAAYSVSASKSNNIHIGSSGAPGDSDTIRIGGVQTSTYIAGIYSQSPSTTPTFLVCADSTGKLATAGCSSTPSSRRFKEQITDMGDSSSKLFQLRPVTFLYKPQYDDGSHSLQYGLIAEEVAEVYPDMVGYDKEGQPNSVKYQSLAPMLLNEVQKQDAQLQLQQEENRKLEGENRKLEEQNRQQSAENRSLEDRLAALEALLSPK